MYKFGTVVLIPFPFTDSFWAESGLKVASGIRFDKLATLQPLTKICTVFGQEFTITDEDLALYKKWRLPLPTNDPLIRLENLWAKMIAKRKLTLSDNEC